MDLDGVKLGVMVEEHDAEQKIDKIWVFRIDGGLTLSGYQIGNKQKTTRRLTRQNIDHAPLIPARVLEKANDAVAAGKILYQRDGEVPKKSWVLPRVERDKIVAEARRRLTGMKSL